MSGTIGDNVYRASGVVAAASAAGGGTSWQAVETGSTMTAVAGNGYPIDTTSNACTVTLPAGVVGNTIEFVDYAGTWDTNNVTLTTTEKIKGSDSDGILNGEREGVTVTYVDATQGWVATSTANETTPAIKSYPVDMLVVGGGGSGGCGFGGGGGAGGLIYKTSHNLAVGTTYNVVIGAGAASNSDDGSKGNQGVDTTWAVSGGAAFDFTAKGGGAGGTHTQGEDATDGGTGGGSGRGDGTGGDDPGKETQTTQPGDSGTYGFGYDGGNGSGGAPYYTAGGGGGAGGAGGNGGSPAGIGGVGKDYSAVFASEGDSGWFASGGGAGWTMYSGGTPAGSASAGGGTAGGTPSAGNSSPAAANTGGGSGGGAAGNGHGGSGGSGVICFKVLTADYSGTTTGSPGTRTDGSYTLVEFTGDGSYTG
jgi:hypothetical protein|tara:strand:- start:76 stop:1338 length:1263 start_codon:yes stop_codon:yes gene_type:complete